MAHRILIIDGHPDSSGVHFVHELARFYRAGAKEGGHAARMLRVGSLEFPMLRTNTEFVSGQVPEAIRAAQKSIAWADHLVFLYPLWLGTMPAVLKAFVEQTFRPGFAFAERGPTLSPERLLKGRSARVIVTTGMRGLFHGRHRTEHSLKSFERDLLGFCGIKPVRVTFFEGVDLLSKVQRDKAYYAMRRLGATAKQRAPHYTYSEVPWRAWLPAISDGHAPDGGPVGRKHYDRVVHSCLGLLIFPTVWELFEARASPRSPQRYLMPVLFVMSHSVIYEMIEWVAAELLGGELGGAYLGTQGDAWDAQQDMALATAGAVAALLLGGVRGRIRRIQPVAPH